jgi:hypothetical protein
MNIDIFKIHYDMNATCPKKIEKLLVMKKVLVEKCTPQQARVEIKTQLKPAKHPKTKGYSNREFRYIKI